MGKIRLISTDFDGTLIGFGSDGKCPAALARKLESHARGGGLWAINTGRSLFHVKEGLERFEAPVSPDFVLTNEREIYRWHENDWLDHGDWNAACVIRHREMFEDAGNLLERIERLARDSGEATVIYEGGLPAGLVTTSEPAMNRLVAEIDRYRTSHEHFHYQRNTIYLRFCHRDYHKGSALGELCRLESVDRSQVFAVGDHHNDLSMLDGTYAAMTACPANAIPEVKAAVEASGGYIALASGGEGVAEAMAHYQIKRPRRASTVA